MDGSRRDHAAGPDGRPVQTGDAVHEGRGPAEAGMPADMTDAESGRRRHRDAPDTSTGNIGSSAGRDARGEENPRI
jgi:hypothetical protein